MVKGKLYKVASLPSSGYSEGDIYFVKNEKKIYIRTASGWEEYNGKDMVPATITPYTATTGKAGLVPAPRLDAAYSQIRHKRHLSVTGWDYVHEQDIMPSKGSGFSLNDMLINPVTNMNVFNFLSEKQIIVEISQDNGTTWVSYLDWINAETNSNYTEATFNTWKRNLLCSFSSTGFNIPRNAENKKSTQCKLRVTITAMDYDVPDGTAETEKINYWTPEHVLNTERYVFVNRTQFNVGTTGAPGIRCTLETQKASTGEWIEQYTSEKMIGWSGWNSKFVGVENSITAGATFGGAKTQTNNYWNWRFTFFICGNKEESDDETVQSQCTSGYLTSGYATIYNIFGYCRAFFTRPIYCNTPYSFTVTSDKSTKFLGVVQLFDYLSGTIGAQLFPSGVIISNSTIRGNVLMSMNNIYEGGTAEKNQLPNKYANKTYNAKSFEAIVIKTDNSTASKTANVAAIKAYTDNLTALGVNPRTDSTMPIPVNIIHNTNRVVGYIQNTYQNAGYYVGILNNYDVTYKIAIHPISGDVILTPLQPVSDSTLTTTSKLLVGAINELNGTVGLMGGDVTTALNNSTNAQETANTADTKADEAKTAASSALTKATNLEDAETTIAGQKVKVGGTITGDNLLKGLQVCSKYIEIVKDSNSYNKQSITNWCNANGITLNDYFVAPVLVFMDQDDTEPEYGLFQNIPEFSVLKGTLSTADTDSASECNRADINTSTGELSYGSAFADYGTPPEYAETEMTYPDVNSGFQTSVTLSDSEFSKFQQLGMKKYVTFSGTPSCGKKVELTLTDSSTTKLTFQHTWWAYSTAFQTDFLQFELDLSTKVLTAMYPKGMV